MSHYNFVCTCFCLRCCTWLILLDPVTSRVWWSTKYATPHSAIVSSYLCPEALSEILWQDKDACLPLFMFIFRSILLLASNRVFKISYKILLLDKKKINLLSTNHKWYLWSCYQPYCFPWIQLSIYSKFDKTWATMLEAHPCFRLFEAARSETGE